MRNFKELKVWQKGIDIAAKTFQLIKLFPSEERYGLSQQMSRAAVSIPSNIAEGSSRSSDKDYKRYLEVSLGSSYELETQLIIAEGAHYGKAELIKEVLTILQDEQKMLMSFIDKLKQ